MDIQDYLIFLERKRNREAIKNSKGLDKSKLTLKALNNMWGKK